MPTATISKPKPQLPKASTAQSAVTKALKAEREIIHPRLVHSFCCEGYDGPITVDQAKQILGWESEPDYVARVTKGLDDKAKAKANVAFPDVGDSMTDGVRVGRVIMEDEEGHKVICWNNARNRPFHEHHARGLAQDILKRVWAGPTNFPDETINGQAGVIISRYGEIENGNHTLVGLVIAGQMWAGPRQGAYWRSFWQTEPVVETSVVYGVSEDPRVVRTIDDVKPRSLGDVVFTGPIFEKLSSHDKKECSRMLDVAAHLLWHRLGHGSGSYTKHQTNSEMCEFISEHKRLVDCVKEAFEVNRERALSKLRLSPGQCAAVLWLMGASKSDADHYSRQEPRGDKGCDWSNWERALEFWRDLGKGDKRKMTAVAEALGALYDEGNGRQAEKLAVLSKAWEAWVAKRTPEEADLELEWGKDDDGNPTLLTTADFGGVDNPERIPATKGEQEEAQVEVAKGKKGEDAVNRAKRDEVRQPLEVAKPEPKASGPDGKPLPAKALSTPLNKGDGKPVTLVSVDGKEPPGAPTSRPAFAEPVKSPKVAGAKPNISSVRAKTPQKTGGK